MNPNFPIYIPSKGRHESRLTVKALEKMNVPFLVVVEDQEYNQYASVIDKKKLLVLDKTYQQKYDTCDDLGDTKSKGPGPARNFIWDHSSSEGYKWHWVMDDNIYWFIRLCRNRRRIFLDGTCFKAMEDFCGRYKNVAMAGPNYMSFVPKRQKHPPFITNTRIYSCNLIRNDVPFRWRGRYNEDTILSLDMLKEKWCTIQFNAFLQKKVETQAIKGGNTKEFYHAEGELKDGEKYAKGGTDAKSKMQVKVHPDVSKLVWKFGRVHHHVDYSQFKKTKLVKWPGIKIEPGINNYGMVLQQNEATA